MVCNVQIAFAGIQFKMVVWQLKKNGDYYMVVMIALYCIRRYSIIITKLDSINLVNTNLWMVHYSDIYYTI